MDQYTPQPDLSLQLPRDMYYQVIHTLCGSLPPPVSASPEDRTRRDNAAIAQSLPPGLTRWSRACFPPMPTRPTLPRSMHAAGLDPVVAASAQALDSMRQARENPSDAARALQCIAQSACIACPGEGRGCARHAGRGRC
jgi:hypothetical protein